MNPSPFKPGTVVSGTMLPSDLVAALLPLVMQVDPDGGIKSFLQPGDAHHKPTPSEAWLAKVLNQWRGSLMDGMLRDLNGPDYGVTDTPLVRRAQPRADRAERVSELVRYLFDKLDHFAPDDHYFGSHEGDGSDYGFWPDWDLPDSDQGIDVHSPPLAFDMAGRLIETPSDDDDSDDPANHLQATWDTMQAAVEAWIKESGQTFPQFVDAIEVCLSADDVI